MAEEVDDVAEGATEAAGRGNENTEGADPQTMRIRDEPEISSEEAVPTNLGDDVGDLESRRLSPMPDSIDDGEPTDHSAGGPMSPRPCDGENKHDLQTNEEVITRENVFEILFDDSHINIFDDGSSEARQKIQGWTNRRWIAASDRALRFTSPVLRVLPSRYFWSSSAVYEKRILATYTNPDTILILRLPKDMDEVRRLGGVELSDPMLDSYMVAETAADPKTCKIRLSQLTNVTSIPINAKGLLNNMINPNKDDVRKQSCFDVLTPAETITLSAAYGPVDSQGDGNIMLFQDTDRCQQSIVSAITNAHSDIIHCIDNNQAWKHQVILGTTHSYVISGNDQALKESLAGAFEIQMNESGSKKIDSTFINVKDDSGRTALHYACFRRRNSTVRILVNAGADCSIAQDVDELTPCHICAKGLDEKTLSIVLSASRPTRPDPNALDRHGKTPMYLAASEGHGDAVALDLCLSALEAWGGQMMTAGSPKSEGQLHPAHLVSAQWKPDELSVILAHCNHRHPFIGMRYGSDEHVHSLSAICHYPLHACIISFRRRVFSALDEQDCNSFNAEFTSSIPALIK